ncbi:MAG: gluconate 2-dehydrogenase subunit 3 family protein [Bryobacterales bacterium]|nr:gluconate 2-dehydrogenase subunit 3 family protein [Bryobacterales bacterium]
MDSRRETLKIIGAIGTTCAFPFGADELYGQHAHVPKSAEGADSAPYKPKFFSETEFAVISRIADLIIPKTDTPGAVEAGVPAYIDSVAAANKRHEGVFREGLRWLESKKFLKRSEAAQIALLTPLSEAVDKNRVKTPQQRFFLAVKNMTADGYYTSRIGLLVELGYKGNTVLSRFPVCAHPEHHG